MANLQNDYSKIIFLVTEMTVPVKFQPLILFTCMFAGILGPLRRS